MSSMNRVPSRGGPGPFGHGVPKLARRVAAAFGFCVVFAACGQVPGAHLRSTGVQAAGRPSPQFSPNGENEGPPPG
ncbi:MAG: hypothetical protein ABR518_10255, partial [Actinomycetota bacterium]